MENTPIITLNGGGLYPGADKEDYERLHKWSDEVYNPLIMKVRSPRGMDNWQILEPNRQYPGRLAINHFASLAAWQRILNNPDSKAVTQDLRTWEERKVRDYIWSAVYELARSFRGQSHLKDKPDTIVDNATVLHVEALRLSSDDRDKYNRWLNDYGFSIIPLFTQLKGVRGYDYFKHVGFAYRTDVRETEYPANPSLIYFENREAFDNFDNSQELTTFYKLLRNVFPRGVNHAWYVQYQLVKSWRK